MPHRARLPVLAQHERPPVAVLLLLRKELSQAAARPVPGTDARALPDAAAGQPQAQVVLVVLVAHQGFVKAAHARQRGTRPAAEVDGVHRAFVSQVPRPRTTHHPAALERRRDGPAPGALAPRHPRAAHVVGMDARQRRQAFGHVIRREGGVHVHAHHHLAARSRQAGVQAGGDDAARVVEHGDAGVRGRARIKRRARAVVAGAVGHQQLQRPAFGQLLSQGSVAEGVNMPPLVAARHDQADQARRARFCQVGQHRRGDRRTHDRAHASASKRR